MNHIIRIIVLSLLMILYYSCSPSHEIKSEKIIASWTELPTTNFPLMRGQYAMAYNSRHKKIVAYGGRTGFRDDFQNVNETWAFDYKIITWVNLEAKDSPPWRSGHTMVYDQVRDMIILFGGNDFTKVFNDLWQYDYSSNTWTNITPDFSPEARQMHGMVYVPDREVIIMFGGRKLNGGASFSDVWELNCKTYTWKKLNPKNNPKVSDHVNITYDQLADKVLLYIAPAIWAYDFDSNNWTELEPTNKPNLDHCSFIYEPQYNKSVLFGNIDESNRFNMIKIPYILLLLGIIGLVSFLVTKLIQWILPINIKGKKSFAIIYMATTIIQVMVIFVFLNSSNRHTWIFDYSTNNWTNITPRNMLNVRIEHDGMVYLEDEQVFVQYGGCCTDETLELKLNQ